MFKESADPMTPATQKDDPGLTSPRLRSDGVRGTETPANSTLISSVELHGNW